jgi:hypothetical protein
MGRISRSIALVGQSYRVLMQDKELMVLPLLSGMLCILAVASAFFGFGLVGMLTRGDRTMGYATIFCVSVVTYAIGIFFQAAIVAGASERMRGGDPTLGSALSTAAAHIGPILGWAIVAATVGTILRIISDRAGFIGKIVVGLVGAAWSLATFFVVPVIVLENRPVGDSVRRSVAIFKETWGEAFVGGLNMGVAAFAAWVTLIAVTGLVAWAGAGVWALGLFVPGAILLVVLFSTLQGVFLAALYRYATTGHAADGFDQTLLSQAFTQKTR